MNIIEYTDMTRPRSASGTMAWISVFDAAVWTIMAKPTGHQQRRREPEVPRERERDQAGAERRGRPGDPAAQPAHLAARRQGQRAQQRTEPRGAHQDPQPSRTGVEDPVGEDRHQHGIRHPREAHQAQEQQDRPDRRRAGRRRRSPPRSGPAASRPRGRDGCGLGCISSRPGQHRQVGDPVQEEAPPLADRRHQDSRDRRPDDPGAR